MCACLLSFFFPECHRAKNYDEEESKSSLTGRAVVELQEALPRARILYASATGVTDIKNMAYFTRLGLWGRGSGFDSFKTFEKSMSTRGIGAFELLAMVRTHTLLEAATAGCHNRRSC